MSRGRKTLFEAENDYKRRRLKHMQWLATALLAGVAVLFALATSLAARHPAWGYVAAFAEAAMVGAIADWFAVVALFRHPLGLRFVPHTAIIPKNKARIADNLGSFVHAEFFSTERVVAALTAFDPSGKLAAWLAHPQNADQLADIALKILRYAFDALDEKAVRAYLRAVVSSHIQDLDLARLAGQLLDHLTEDGRHQRLLDQMLEKVSLFVSQPETQALLETAIAEKLPLYFEALKQKGATAATHGIVKIFAKVIAEVDADPAHPLRLAFDEKLSAFIGALQTDPAYRAKLAKLKEKMVRNRVLTTYLDDIWRDARAWLARDLHAPDSRTRARLATLTGQMGRELAGSATMRAWIDGELLRHVPGWVERYGPRLGRFIAEKMKSWKDEEIVEKLELNIGRDLQFIRINGTLVGGAVGLAIHAFTAALA
jgi:uncharacterized membrane-anchored protein YjiN (DUF445 family)